MDVRVFKLNVGKPVIMSCAIAVTSRGSQSLCKVNRGVKRHDNHPIRVVVD